LAAVVDRSQSDGYNPASHGVSRNANPLEIAVFSAGTVRIVKYESV